MSKPAGVSSESQSSTSAEIEAEDLARELKKLKEEEAALDTFLVFLRGRKRQLLLEQEQIHRISEQQHG
ncbi:hypothetical protein QR680_011274 [Steinernema hermaphroditum]|nr:hypothetical protein QR680_011274 [Steinernema hermaphroditum]